MKAPFSNRRFIVILLFCVVAAAYASRRIWLTSIADGLVCDSSPVAVGTILIDNFDYEYWLFKRSADLQRQQPSLRVLVPLLTHDTGDLNVAAREVTNAFARVARLSAWEIIPVREREPISLNVAYQVRDFLVRHEISSVTLVSSRFRSRRSEMIYRSVLGARGIRVNCQPIADTLTPETWTTTWHGIQDVGLQFIKLQYYRFWVVPFRDEQP